MGEMQTLEKIPRGMLKDLTEIGKCEDIATLRKDLIRTLSVTVEQIVRLAAIVRRLEELGDDLSDVELSLLPQLRKVAYGQLLPDLVLELQGRPSLLRKVSALPLPDQRKIATGVPLKVMQGDGDHRLVPPLKLTDSEVSQVLGDDHIRDEGEQASWLRDRESRTRTPEKHNRSEVYVDMKARGIRVLDVFIPASDLAHYLSQLTLGDRSRRRSV